MYVSLQGLRGEDMKDRRETPQERYDRNNTVRVALKLNTKTDADILARLEEVGNKQGYIKELIRKDISR